MSKNVYLDAPNLGAVEKRYLGRAIDTGYVSTAGPFVPEFEEAFARYLGTRCAVSTQSGTAALHVALHELGIGAGDEVIVPALTFVATVSPIRYVGAIPVFADVDSVTWTIDPDDVERRITGRTKAIIPVHLYGNPCDMGRIMKIARRHRLRVIEDATESLGARYDGAHTGTIGDLGCYSFNGNKVITTGGGGMVVGKNTRHMGHIKFLVNQARQVSLGYYHPEIGFNYRMTNLEAAIGLAQMKKLRYFLSRKKTFNRIYRKVLAGAGTVRFQEECPLGESQWWLTCVLLENKVPVQSLLKRLEAAGVPARRVFMPVTQFPPYRKYAEGRYANANHIYEKGLCLPASTLNAEEDIRRSAGILRGLITRTVIR